MMHDAWVLCYLQGNRVLMINDVLWGLIWWGYELNISNIEVGGVYEKYQISGGGGIKL
jgi:hypothetical protein